MLGQRRLGIILRLQEGEGIMQRRRFGTYAFGLILRSDDSTVLARILEYVARHIQNAQVVYSVGPTTDYLWILVKHGGDRDADI
jgi:hypothetical protein